MSNSLPAHRERVSSAARRTGRSPRTIRRWIDTGRITGYRIGPRLIYVDPREIDQLVSTVVPRNGQIPEATADRIAEYVAGVVADAPPLSDDQKRRIAHLFAPHVGAGGGHVA